VFILSDTNPSENSVNDGGEGGHGPQGVPGSLFIGSASGGCFEIWGRGLTTLGGLLEAEPWVPWVKC
jgi:hypothetical protein